jgi:hypothetical protein
MTLHNSAELSKPALADSNSLQYAETTSAYRHASPEQPDGTVVVAPLPYAVHLPIEEAVLLLVRESYA